MKKKLDSKKAIKLIDDRNNPIVKANALIQKSRYDLTVQEQKILLYLISKIMPDDVKFKEYEFSIKEFCEICDISYVGSNYLYIQDTIKKLRDKSFWIDNGISEILLSWIQSAEIEKNNSTLKIEISEKMKPYLLELKEKFTVDF